MVPVTIIEDRLAKLDEIELGGGSHQAPPSTCDKPEGCFMEIEAWLAGLKWSDHPELASPVLGAFMRRLNDGLPTKERQLLKRFNGRIVGTAGDGQDEARGWLAADWATRTALPAWLELAGITEAAEGLRALPPIDSAKAYEKARTIIVSEVRDITWKARRERRERLYELVKQKVAEELEKRGTAVADAAADAAAVADAVAVAVAAADAAAAAAAVAAAVADAAADADAVAAADAAAAADLKWPNAGYYKVREAAYNAAKPILDEKYEPVRAAILPSALELIEKMIDPKGAAA